MHVEIYWVNAGLPGRIAIMPCPEGEEELGKDIRCLRDLGVNTLVSLLSDCEAESLGLEEEGRWCEVVGIEFIRFPIRDRGIPDDAAEVRKLAECLLKRLKAGHDVAVHCFAGIGRSAVIAAVTLMLGGIAPGDAFELISAARGYDVPDTREQRAWVYSFSDSISGPQLN